MQLSRLVVQAGESQRESDQQADGISKVFNTERHCHRRHRVALRLWQYSVRIACGSKNVLFLLPQVIFLTAASDGCFLRGRGTILKAKSLVAVNTRCSLNRLWRYSVVPDARLCICVYVSMYLSMYFSMDLTSIYLSYLILSNLI